eukprot:8620022-Pyramimonas_sp.AAC.1
MGPRNVWWGVPKWVRGTQSDGGTGAFDKVPCGGHETCEGCAEMCAEDACGRWHWGLRWGSLWGYGTCEGWCRNGCGWRMWTVTVWGLRWSSL